MLSQITRDLVAAAIKEDLGSGDVTTDAILTQPLPAAAEIIAKEELVVCGHEVAKFVADSFDSNLKYIEKVKEGVRLSSGEVVAELQGNFQAILKAERLILNFMQRLSGIATVTNELVSLVNNPSIKILDTRKTTPGWRELEKYAVRVGGGCNHRVGLFDQVLIKNNHIDAIGGDVAKAIRLSKDKYQDRLKIEVEVRNLDELNKALTELPDIILLDNFSPSQIKEAVKIIRDSKRGKELKIEVSGGINKHNIKEYSISGIDFISLGMLTHSVRSVDLSLRYKK
ncbi:MAG: carboxylating nicotinate-nucleotide diphosphorylase [Proteobacteria bacterium]|nr:carboxylating nicotinate-nucleotide diphosphorylase [Pseudomonadota bacterium]